MEAGGDLLLDLLWSDPTASDQVEGIQPSPRGVNLVTFGPDRVRAFCEANSLQVIIRAHECVMDGANATAVPPACARTLSPPKRTLSFSPRRAMNRSNE